MKQCNIELNKNSKIITLQINKQYEKKFYDVKGIYKTLFKSEKIYMDEFLNDFKTTPVLIKTLIAGSGQKGVSFYNINYIAENGYKNAWLDFRDYCYECYGIKTNDCSNNNIVFVNNENATLNRIINNNNNIKKYFYTKNGIIVNWYEMRFKTIRSFIEKKYLISVDGSCD